MLIDAHCHYDSYSGQELDLALKETRENNILTLGTSMDPDGYARTKNISRSNPLIIPCFGIHPWNAHKYADALDIYSTQIKESPLLGEIGLDFHFVKDASLYPQQRRVIEYFLQEAKSQKKLVNLHTKGAENDILEYLRQFQLDHFIIHWYSGPLDLVERFLALGATFTIGVAVLDTKHVRKLASILPAERLLTETDNPGALEWKTQERGMPTIIKQVVLKLAEIISLDQAEMEFQIQENFKRLISSNAKASSILAKLNSSS
jgi:TatD DNase family protein